MDRCHLLLWSYTHDFDISPTPYADSTEVKQVGSRLLEDVTKLLISRGYGISPLIDKAAKSEGTTITS